MENAHLASEDEIKRAVARGRWYLNNEVVGVRLGLERIFIVYIIIIILLLCASAYGICAQIIQLHKYRAMRKRYS